MDTSDKIIWMPNSSSYHTIRSFYHYDKTERFNLENSLLWENFWKAKLHDRHKIITWRIAIDSLP